MSACVRVVCVTACVRAVCASVCVCGVCACCCGSVLCLCACASVVGSVQSECCVCVLRAFVLFASRVRVQSDCGVCSCCVRVCVCVVVWVQRACRDPLGTVRNVTELRAFARPAHGTHDRAKQPSALHSRQIGTTSTIGTTAPLAHEALVSNLVGLSESGAAQPARKHTHMSDRG